MMEEYLSEMNAYADRVAELLSKHGDDVCAKRATAIHNGWDDGVIIACGESETTIICRAHRKGEMDIEGQVEKAVPYLRKREADRIAYEKAIDDTVARFYV